MIVLKITKKEYFDNFLLNIFESFNKNCDYIMIDLTMRESTVIMSIDLLNKLLFRKHKYINENLLKIKYTDNEEKSNFSLKLFLRHESDIVFMNRILGRENDINNDNQRTRQRNNDDE